MASWRDRFGDWSGMSYGELQQEFQRRYGQSFNYQQYLQNPYYMGKVLGISDAQLEQVRQLGARQGSYEPSTWRTGSEMQALEQLRGLDLASALAFGSERFQPINVRGLYGQAQENINQFAEAAKQQAAMGIQRQAEKGERQATHALAGTGLGRSGFAAEVFGGLGEAAIEATAQAEQQIELDRIAKQAMIEREIAEKQYGDQLRIAQWKEQDIRSAMEFDRMLYQMQLEFENQQELLQMQADVNDPGWGGVLGGILGLGFDAASLYMQWQTGTAALGALQKLGG